MKLPSLSSKNHHHQHHHTVPDATASTWPWPYCHQPRTLSFRDADPDPIFKTINSAFVLDPASDPSFPSAAAASSSEESPSFSTAPSELPDDRADAGGGGGGNDDEVECLIRGARSERRLFFEPSRGDTSSILADPRSRSNEKPNEDACEANEEEEEEDGDVAAFKKENVTLLAMESRDPYEDFRKSMEEMVEAHVVKVDPRSGSNAKPNEDASEANEEEEDDGDVAAFKKEDVTLLAMESRDPYEDFRKSMEEMVEAHGVKGDDWECLEQLLCWYLRVNDPDNHGYIYGAFVDLLVDGDRLRRRGHQCRIPGHQSPSSPLSLYNTSSSSLLSSSSSLSLSARRVSISEAEETVSETTPCSSSSSRVSLVAVEDEGGRLRR